MSDMSALGVTLALAAIGVAIMGVGKALDRIAAAIEHKTPPSPER